MPHFISIGLSVIHSVFTIFATHVLTIVHHIYQLVLVVAKSVANHNQTCPEKKGSRAYSIQPAKKSQKMSHVVGILLD